MNRKEIGGLVKDIRTLNPEFGQHGFTYTSKAQFEITDYGKFKKLAIPELATLQDPVLGIIGKLQKKGLENFTLPDTLQLIKTTLKLNRKCKKLFKDNATKLNLDPDLSKFLLGSGTIFWKKKGALDNFDDILSTLQSAYGGETRSYKSRPFSSLFTKEAGASMTLAFALSMALKDLGGADIVPIALAMNMPPQVAQPQDDKKKGKKEKKPMGVRGRAVIAAVLTYLIIVLYTLKLIYDRLRITGGRVGSFSSILDPHIDFLKVLILGVTLGVIPILYAIFSAPDEREELERTKQELDTAARQRDIAVSAYQQERAQHTDTYSQLESKTKELEQLAQQPVQAFHHKIREVKKRPDEIHESAVGRDKPY